MPITDEGDAAIVGTDKSHRYLRYALSMQIISLPDADSLAQFAARYTADVITTNNYRNLALSGGSTPKVMYRYLRKLDLPWEEIDLWLGDERWVPPDDPESNARMARETLSNHVPARLLEVPWGVDAELAASTYEATLHSRFAAPDVVLLGIGDDGHTASLFPDSPALGVADRDYVAHFVPSIGVTRLTATFRFLASSKKLVFLVSGTGKAATLVELLEGSSELPAQRVALSGVDVTWLVDDAAAALLTATTVRRP